MNYDNMTIAELIDLFRNKACCAYSPFTASRILATLKKKITDIDAYSLSVAWSHVRTEGTDELFRVCKDLSIKYQREN